MACSENVLRGQLRANRIAFYLYSGKGFIFYTLCCMGKTLAVLMAYNGMSIWLVRLFRNFNQSTNFTWRINYIPC